MAFIEWSDSLSVGVREIDKEHKEEVELINALHDATGKDRIRLLDKVVAHTVKHFATEEKYFDRFGYKDAKQHKAAHKLFLEQAGKIQQDVHAGKGLSENSLNVVKTWLVNHIKSMDQKYTGCFNEHGLC